MEEFFYVAIATKKLFFKYHLTLTSDYERFGHFFYKLYFKENDTASFWGAREKCREEGGQSVVMNDDFRKEEVETVLTKYGKLYFVDF